MSRPLHDTVPAPPLRVRRGMTRGAQPWDRLSVHAPPQTMAVPPPPGAPRDWQTRPTVRVPAVELPYEGAAE